MLLKGFVFILLTKYVYTNDTDAFYPFLCSQHFSCFNVLAIVNSECSGEW